MEYPKKLVEDYRIGKISRNEFEKKFSALQKSNGLNSDCKGYGDKNGFYYIYRGQKAEIKNGVICWTYGKAKTSRTLYEFKRKVDNQIMRENIENGKRA